MILEAVARSTVEGVAEAIAPLLPQICRAELKAVLGSSCFVWYSHATGSTPIPEFAGGALRDGLALLGFQVKIYQSADLTPAAYKKVIRPYKRRWKAVVFLGDEGAVRINLATGSSESEVGDHPPNRIDPPQNSSLNGTTGYTLVLRRSGRRQRPSIRRTETLMTWISRLYLPSRYTLIRGEGLYRVHTGLEAIAAWRQSLLENGLDDRAQERVDCWIASFHTMAEFLETLAGKGGRPHQRCYQTAVLLLKEQLLPQLLKFKLLATEASRRFAAAQRGEMIVILDAMERTLGDMVRYVADGLSRQMRLTSDIEGALFDGIPISSRSEAILAAIYLARAGKLHRRLLAARRLATVSWDAAGSTLRQLLYDRNPEIVMTAARSLKAMGLEPERDLLDAVHSALTIGPPTTITLQRILCLLSYQDERDFISVADMTDILGKLGTIREGIF